MEEIKNNELSQTENTSAEAESISEDSSKHTPEKDYSLIEKKAAEYDRLVMAHQAAEAHNSKVEQIRTELFSAADAIKAADKSFDLYNAYHSDNTFKNVLEKTGSVPEAYTAMMENRKKQSSFKENGNSYISPGHISATAANLSDDDFEEYIRKIEGNL